MKYTLDRATCRDFSVSSRLEWILPNGLGGYAMGTVAGSNSRRYHGHLVAATKPPTERFVLLAAIEAYATIAGQTFGLSTNQYVGAVHPLGYSLIESFSAGEAVEWVFNAGGNRICKRLRMHPGRNSCTVEYTNLCTQPVQLTLRPLVCHKFYHDNFRVTDFYPQFLVFPEGRTILVHNEVQLCLEHSDADRTPTTGWYYRFEHPRESERGLDPIDDLYCPCELRYMLGPGQSATLVASTEEGESPLEFPDERFASDEDTSLLLEQAASLFIVDKGPRPTMIAGYPWFTDWGRDTMISLPGICLCTGRVELAKSILRSYAAAMRQGLIPNRFADISDEPEYNTVDGTLWFVNAVYLTLRKEWDQELAEEAAGWFQEIRRWHYEGTLYGIQVDRADGLLRQGAPGVQLTWMDAKVGDWVVTPRHGKPVEVNGLWINALRVMAWLCEKLGQDNSETVALAVQAEASFQAKFWKPTLGHYLDTVEPDDGSLRPNQLICMALPFGPARGPSAEQALAKIRNELWTPNGIRTLSPHEPGYRGRYEGSLPERDAAYHQGTSWPWLVGQYASAVLRVSGDVEEARSSLSSARVWLQTFGMGGIAEVFDGDSPQYPGGCPWQAWSVAEVLRACHHLSDFIDRQAAGQDPRSELP